MILSILVAFHSSPGFACALSHVTLFAVSDATASRRAAIYDSPVEAA